MGISRPPNLSRLSKGAGLKILYLMPDFPYPATGGGPLRIMGLVLGVAEAGHEVHVISFGDSQKTATPLHENCASVELVEPPARSKLDRLKTLLLTQKADMETRRWSAKFIQVLERKLQSHTFDIVQCQSLEMTPYLLYLRQRWPQLKLVYDAYNAEAELQRMAYQTDRATLKKLPLAVYSRMQWKRIEALEHSLSEAADAIIAVSEIDQQILQVGNAPVYLVPNGIHVGAYLTSPTQPLHQPALIFTGTMDYRPNVDAARWFADEILPHIPTAHLYIVGNRPTAAVQALASRENIIVTGFVEEVQPYLHTATVFIVPMRVGSGTRLKMLQAMVCGCAIVSTTVGAAGLNARHGEHLLLADDAPSFAAAVNDLLHNPERRHELGENARRFVQEKFDWSVIVPRLLQVYEQLRS